MLFWKSFLALLCFLVKNAKNNIFEDKCFLSKMFYQIKMQAALKIHCRTADSKSFRALQILYLNCLRKAEFL